MTSETSDKAALIAIVAFVIALVIFIVGLHYLDQTELHHESMDSKTKILFGLSIAVLVCGVIGVIIVNVTGKKKSQSGRAK